jgi:hypothetical protein
MTCSDADPMPSPRDAIPAPLSRVAVVVGGTAGIGSIVGPVGGTGVGGSLKPLAPFPDLMLPTNSSPADITSTLMTSSGPGWCAEAAAGPGVVVRPGFGTEQGVTRKSGGAAVGGTGGGVRTGTPRPGYGVGTPSAGVPIEALEGYSLLCIVLYCID